MNVTIAFFIVFPFLARRVNKLFHQITDPYSVEDSSDGYNDYSKPHGRAPNNLLRRSDRQDAVVPQMHEEVRAAREQLCAVAVLFEQRDSFIQRCWCVIFESVHCAGAL